MTDFGSTFDHRPLFSSLPIAAYLSAWKARRKGYEWTMQHGTWVDRTSSSGFDFLLWVFLKDVEEALSRKLRLELELLSFNRANLLIYFIDITPGEFGFL